MTPCAQCFSHALCPNVAATVSNVIRCGFYFFPYASSEAIAAQLEINYATDFDITWAPSSYLANADQFPGFDYTLLKEDTHTNDNSYMMYEKFGPIAQYAERWANAPKLETPSFAQLNEYEKKRHLNQLKAHVTTIKDRSK
mmetsp:Transcript_16746/g.53914  ORF Transcript_16746/g.53914 Transcript_16746/m.53914 type:complete len:141 (-) Transcript_16746:256-678(-)